MAYLAIDMFLTEHKGCYFDDYSDPMLIVFALDMKQGVKSRIKELKQLLKNVGYKKITTELDASEKVVWVVVKGSFDSFHEKIGEALKEATTEDPINIIE